MMGALRNLSNLIPKPTSNTISPPSFFISSRSIVTKLFIGGLSFYTTQKGLFDAFSKHGQVIEAKVVTDRVTEKSKGFGFVTYASEDEAEKATREMNGKPLDGRVIFVDYAKALANFSSGAPIARGPPDSAKASDDLLESMEQETS